MKKDLYQVPSHRYDFAGFMNKLGGNPVDGKLTTGAFAGMNADLAGALPALGSAVGGVAGGLIGGGRTSAAGDVIEGLSKMASAIPGPWGAIAGAGLGVIGGLTNAAFGVKLNQENINAVNNNIASLNSFQSNASDFDTLAQNYMSQPSAMRFDQNFIGKNGWFNKGATKKFNELVAQQDMAKQFVDNSLNNNMTNLVNNQNRSLLANYAAFGGSLNTHGADWNTGLNYIGNGGSHESNPNDGVPMGIAPDGLPNLVEEGEVIWNNDYVFSKRLKVPKAIRHKYKLGGPKQVSFADAAMILNKDAEERPNDPITIKGRDAMLGKLAEVQEERRARIAAKEQSQQPMPDMMGMPQDQMTMEEQPTRDNIMSEANQEELARQEIMRGMQQPMVEGYAAKGGPIGHRYDNAGWLTPYPWLESFDPFDNYDLALKGMKPYSSYSGPTSQEVTNFTVPLQLPAIYGLMRNSRYGNIDNPTAAPMNMGNLVYPGFTATPYRNAIMKLTEDQYADLLKSVKRKPSDFKDRNAFITAAEKGKPDKLYNGINSWFESSGLTNNTLGPSVIPKKQDKLPQLATPPITPDLPQSSLPQTKWSKYREFAERHNAINGNNNSNKSPWLANLRYAPAIATGIMSLTDLLGWTNRPDYSAADAMLEASKGVRDVSFNPIGNYARYVAPDTKFGLNTLLGVAGSAQRGILNTSGGNRGTAMAGLLAANNNYLNSVGNTLFTGENTAFDRYMKSLAHNTDIDKFNSEGFLKAAIANQGSSEVRAKYNALAADARQKALMLANNNRSINSTNFIDSLGAIGEDVINRYDRNRLGTLRPGAQDYYWGALGGKLNRKSKRRTR